MIKIKLTEQLEKLGKNATEVAVETNINRNTINSLVNQKSEGVRFSTLDKICQTYNLAITDIIDFKIEMQPGIISKRKLYKQEAEMVPFTIWPGMIALSKIKISLNNKIQDFGRMDGYFKKHYMVAYWDYSAMNEFAKIFFALYSKPAEIDRYYSEFQVTASEIENLYNSLYGKKPSDCNEEYFKSTLNLIERLYLSFWLKSFFIETFDAGFDQEEVKKIALRYKFDKKEIEILTQPVNMTFENKRKLELLKIAVKMVGKKGSTSELMEKNRDDIENYKREFDSYRSNYAEVFHIEDKEIIEEIKRYLKDTKLVKNEIKRLSEFQSVQEKEIELILKKHHLKTNPLYFFNKLTFFREHRKTVNLKGFHILDFILSYLEIKTGIAKKYLKFLSFEEIEGVLNGLVTKETLQRRYEEGILVAINYTKRNEIKVFEGNEAYSITEDLEKEYLHTEGKNKSIKGYTASQGYVKGIAKIVLTHKDFSKFKHGDILVTSMTKSDFMPLIKRAGGIVADEGGISSHTAVVSRELDKPCVIGTKRATKLIKDGDLIEVRANHGSVRILKSK